MTIEPGSHRCGATNPRQIDRLSVGDIRLDVIRPTIRARPPSRSMIWQASGGTHAGIDGLEPDEPLVVVALQLPHQLGPAGEVLLLELDQPSRGRRRRPG